MAPSSLICYWLFGKAFCLHLQSSQRISCWEDWLPNIGKGKVTTTDYPLTRSFPTQCNQSSHQRILRVSYGEVLGDKSAIYIRMTLYWGYSIILWLFHLGVSCTAVVLTCFVMCGCFGNMCVCIYCVLYCLYCVFLLFRLCIFILICFVCTSVRTTATEWQLNCS